MSSFNSRTILHCVHRRQRLLLENRREWIVQQDRSSHEIHPTWYNSRRQDSNTWNQDGANSCVRLLRAQTHSKSTQFPGEITLENSKKVCSFISFCVYFTLYCLVTLSCCHKTIYHRFILCRRKSIRLIMLYTCNVEVGNKECHEFILYCNFSSFCRCKKCSTVLLRLFGY